MNNYHIYEEIGHGKFSVVYKGRKKKTIEYMAVKSLEKQRRQKVQDEVKILRSISHPNIIKFFDWYETRNHLWVILEYCAGGNLYQLIEQDSCLDEPTVRQMGKDLVLGLQYIHSQGIIYCDLKPANILINEYGALKISDFGLARKLVDMINQPAQESKKGTPHYMAPELFQEDGVHSFQSDLWAFGIMLYELATGKLPFSSSVLTEIINMIIKQDIPKVEKFSKNFNSLLVSLLHKDPLKRISWKELINHPFWEEKLPNLAIPQQPHFETYLRRKQLLEEQMRTPRPLQNIQLNQVGEPHSSLADKLASMGDKSPNKSGHGEVNLLRISINARKNLQKEEAGDSYKQENLKRENDIRIVNKNQQFDFGDNSKNENEDDFGYEDDNQEEEKIEIQDQFVASKKPQLTENKSKFREQQPSQILDDSSIVQTPGSQRPGEGYQTPVARVKTQPIEQLLTHNTDNQVKPIIGSKEIEKLGETVFNKDQLPFEIYTLEEVSQKIESAPIEKHLELIYNLLSSATEKLNVLNYFETIIQHSNVANRLINSQFINLLIRLLKQSRNVNVKIRLASIIGLLIRHATVIENELSNLGITNVMIEVMRAEKNEKVKRRCMAALGEYLFYGATQIDEDPTNVVWEMSAPSFQTILKIIKTPQEDEIVKYYAAKTIENITAQSVKTGLKFSNQEMCQALIEQIFLTQNQGLKTCSVICLNHMTVLQSSLIDYVLDKLKDNLIELLHDSTTPRIQQGLLSIINMYIIQTGSVMKNFSNNRQFYQTIVHLLDNTQQVIRGKSILTILLLIKVNLRSLVYLAETKYFVYLDKLERDNYKYVQQCLYHLMEQMEEVLPSVLKSITEDLQKLASSSQQAHQLSGNSFEYVGQNQSQRLRGNLNFLNVVLQYLNSSVCRGFVYKIPHLETVFAYLDYCDLASSPESTVLFEDVKTSLFMVYENIVGNQKMLGNNSDFFIKNVFSKLTINFLNNPQADLRFSCLKLFIDVLGILMSDPHVYDERKQNGRYINDFILKNIISNLKKLLTEQEPIPLYALKLVNLIVEKSSTLAQVIIQQKLAPQFVEYVELGHPLFTKNSLKILVALTKQPEIPIQELFQLKVVGKVCQIFATHLGQKQDWSSEDLLDIQTNILKKYLDCLHTQPNPETSTLLTPIVQDPAYSQCAPLLAKLEQFFEIYELTLGLISHSDYSKQSAALRVLQHMIFIFQSDSSKRSRFFKPEYLAVFCSSIVSSDNLVNLRMLAKNLQWSLQAYGQPVKGSDKKDLILQALQKLSQLDDPKLNAYVKEITKSVQF